MIPIDTNQTYWIVRGKTDLRKGIDTLAILLQHEFDQDPFDGAYYFFCGRRSDRFKLLPCDGEGFRLIYKYLENGKLPWPKAEEFLLEELATLYFEGCIRKKYRPICHGQIMYAKNYCLNHEDIQKELVRSNELFLTSSFICKRYSHAKGWSLAHSSPCLRII